jgi:hypothetical protein
MAEAYLDLAWRVPAYDLRFVGRLDALPEILAGIEAIIPGITSTW